MQSAVDKQATHAEIQGFHLGGVADMAEQVASSEAAATQVGAMVTAKVPYMHGTVLVPEYPVATHVNVQSAPLATSEAEQSVVYASFPVPPAAMLPVHGAGTASQQTAAVVPVTPDPLFWVLA